MLLSEYLVVLLSLVIPLVVISGGALLIVRLYQRIQQLEARVQQLEDKNALMHAASSRGTIPDSPSSRA